MWVYDKKDAYSDGYYSRLKMNVRIRETWEPDPFAKPGSLSGPPRLRKVATHDRDFFYDQEYEKGASDRLSHDLDRRQAELARLVPLSGKKW